MMTPPTVMAMAEATAAPSTPQPAPGQVNFHPNRRSRRVGKMSRKFSATLTMLTQMPAFIGVLLSPAARSTVPKMMVATRAAMGV